MNTEKCENCRFRVAGKCRRNPPVMTQEHTGFKHMAKWPEVEIHDWCGQWEKKRDE